MTNEEKEDNKRISTRGVRFYELYHYFKYAIDAERPNLRFKPLIFCLIFLLMLLNFILLTIPQKLISRILDMAFVEVNGNTVGGFMIVNKLKSHGYYHFGGFFIRSKYQGKGYGNQVMTLIIEGYGHSKISLAVDGNNDRAIHLYKKYGFKISESSQKYQISLPLKGEIPENLPEGIDISTLSEDFLDELVGRSEDLHSLLNIDSFYKDFEEYQKKKRFTNKQILLLRYKGQIAGLSRVKWKTIKNKAEFNTAFAEKHVDLFPYLLQRSIILAMNQGAAKLEWNRCTQNEFLYKYMKPFLDQPVKYDLTMERL
ncbi:MAG: GNAT family N-acetyltransferase [Candidatus Heimdallarchaeota archaeon]|nr:GNAT family N-acetyltransferase [Candidatus Heimdallarchaeota archaeon]